MHFKKMILASLLAFATAPMLGYAVDEVDIYNNTQSTTVTAKVGSFCSSNFSGGKLHPGETYKMKHSDLKSLCGNDKCTAKVYASSDCKSDRKIAVVELDASDGVIGINNNNQERFSIVNSNTYVELDDANQAGGIKAWFEKFFS